jgi:hypothetical protein
MDTVSSGDFIQHDVIGDGNACWVIDMLVHTDPGQDKPVIIMADSRNEELRTYDLTSWQCVSQCTTASRPWCMYESDGGAYVQCEYGSLYRIVSVRPLTLSTHGHVTGVECYDCISHLGSGRLVAVSPHKPAVHIIDLHGRQLADLTTCGEYRFTGPWGVVCGGSRVVVSVRDEGNCLGREWHGNSRVVCLEESAGSWSVQWMYDARFTTTPVITPGGGTVIVLCGTSPTSIVSLSLETGAVIQQVDVSPGCPELGSGTCIYGGSLLVPCAHGGVIEISLQGKMSCSHSNCSADPLYI